MGGGGYLSPQFYFDNKLIREELAKKKEAEENRLKKDMLQAAMLQTIRRLSFSLKPKKKNQTKVKEVDTSDDLKNK